MRVERADIGIVINSLVQIRANYPEEKQDQIDETLLFLYDIYDSIKPKRKKRVNMDYFQKRLIINCLNEWRNLCLSTGEEIKADAISEVLLAFYE